MGTVRACISSRSSKCSKRKLLFDVLVYESFKDYIAVESLDGDNKYDAGDYGLQVSLFLRTILVVDWSNTRIFTFVGS